MHSWGKLYSYAKSCWSRAGNSLARRSVLQSCLPCLPWCPSLRLLPPYSVRGLMGDLAPARNRASHLIGKVTDRFIWPVVVQAGVEHEQTIRDAVIEEYFKVSCVDCANAPTFWDASEVVRLRVCSLHPNHIHTAPMRPLSASRETSCKRTWSMRRQARSKGTFGRIERSRRVFEERLCLI